jgi:hypothetical protein
VRWAPAGPHQNKIPFVQERRRRTSHGEFTSHRSITGDQRRPDLPKFSQIEHLLGIYVATGEGQGAFLAAKVAETKREESEARWSHASGQSHRSRSSSFTDSSNSASDSDPRPGPRPPPRPSGGPSGGPDISLAYEEGRRPSEFRPSDDLGPQAINRPRPAHTSAERPANRMEAHRRRYTAAPRRPQPQASVVDESEEEPLYASLPPQEQDFRIYAQTETPSRRQSSRRRSSNRIGMRGGGGLDYDPEEARSDRDGPNFLHLRGGAPDAEPITGMSSLTPYHQETNTLPRKIK